jgi:4-hydroxy-2-oxoheptanedioate aldolase
MAAIALKSRFETGDTLYAAWHGFAAPQVAVALARDGWDAVVIDMQHGQSSYRDMAEAVAGVAAAGVAPVVRVGIGDEVLLGRAPDAGATGVICPMVNSGQEASAFARACKYPPLGQRSFAGVRAMQVHGMTGPEYLKAANDLVLTFAMVETAQALKHIDSIASTPGIDAIFVGPNDLSVSLSDGGAVDPTLPKVEQAMRLIARKCEAHQVVAGAFANTPEIARTYREMGFRFIAVSTDATYLSAGSRAMLKAAKDLG